MNPELTKSLIAAAPLLLSPFVAWFLARSGTAREVSQVDYFAKRLDLIDKLRKFQSDDALRDMMERELHNIDAFLARQDVFLHPHAKADASPHSRSWLGRFFLISPSQTIRQRVFKGMFYLFFGFVLFGALGAAILSTTEGARDWFASLIGGLFWLGIALVFRHFAKPAANA
jgi:hypothetical protein